jgi:hypothetical protein
MAKIETFLKTGELGPLVIGLSSSEVMEACGEPNSISRKSNPLILQYGRIQLTFVRNQPTDRPRLQDILVFAQPETGFPPLFMSQLYFDDFPLQKQPTKSQFLAFSSKIGCSPVLGGENQLHFASGVKAAFDDDLLSSLRLSKKEAAERPSAPIIDEREPTIEQIQAMLGEAMRADSVDASSAALLIAWAAMEAVLRRAAQSRGLKGRVGVAPQNLIRELFNNRFLSPSEMRLLEEVRQVRMAAAHGLAQATPSPLLLQDLIGLARNVVARVQATH